MIRLTCGTLHGAQDHQAAGERPCGWCSQAEATARVTAEGIPTRPAPGPVAAAPADQCGWLAPVTAAEAARNAADLRRELVAHERHVQALALARRHLAIVPDVTDCPSRRSA